MKKIILSLLLVVPVLAGFGQLSKKEAKAIEKSIKFYEDQKYDKAIDKLSPVLEKYKYNDKLWELNIEYYFRGYMKERSSLNSLAKLLGDIEMKDDDGNPMQVTISSSGMFSLDSFLEQCARNSRLINNAQMANIYLRNFLVDIPVDTAVSEEAKGYFHQAEGEFQKKNYSKAIEYYGKALEVEPEYYKAALYLGDCHWADGRPEKALTYFKKAVEKQPSLLEPRKYVTDALLDIGETKKAYTACIDGIIAYPDGDMFRRMDEICNKLGKEFEQGWIARDFTLNAVDKEQPSIEATPWNYYREAKSKIEPFCDKNGIIIKQNDLTKQKYLETYCWEYMLKNTEDKQFEFARKAMNSGYLDCYALVSMYHISIYNQFEDFAGNNASRIHDYFNLILTSDK